MASVSFYVGQSFALGIAPTQADGVTPGGIGGPVTYVADTPGIVTVMPSADPLNEHPQIVAAAVGTCNLTPTAPNEVSGGPAVVGSPIAITVTAPPPTPATQLVETIGPVTGP
jgi:hypothetical protein